MKVVEVKFSHAGDNGEPYYRTLPSNQLLVVVDGAWHTAIDDDTWQEADHPIDMNKYTFNIVDDETL